MLKIITLKFEEKIENFDDTVMADFLVDKNVIKWEGKFFERKGSPFWTVFLEYEPAIQPGETVSATQSEKTRDDYIKLLKRNDWPLFKRLKEWRGETGRSQGVPPYIIFKNIQLAKIASARPGSLNAIRQIEGVGDVKTKKYGKAVIKIIKSFGKSPAPGKG